MQRSVGLNKLLRLLNEGWMIAKFDLDGYGGGCFAFHRLFSNKEIVARWELDMLLQQEYLEVFRKEVSHGLTLIIWKVHSGVVVIEKDATSAEGKS